jgi:phosphate transport system protein
MWKEILAIFNKDTLLDQAYKRSYEMLDITHQMFQEARISLRERNDNKLAEHIYDQDIAVNKFEREVRRKVLSHLAVSGSTDLYSGLVLVSIIIDVERIGDYTKNIVEMAQNHPPKLTGGLYEDDLAKVETAVNDVFTRVREIFEVADAGKAEQLLVEYQWINKVCDQHAIDYLNERDRTISSGDAVALSLYFRFLKRINSHLRNVATSVVNPFDKIGFYRRKDDIKKR